MEQFYQVLAWVSVFFYWLIIAGVTMRVVFKRRVVGVSLAWLMIIYIIPVGGVFAYLLVGELNLGKKTCSAGVGNVPTICRLVSAPE